MNILFAFAHPDDEAFGPAGTIAKLVCEGHTVTVLIMCNGARPGSEHVAEARQRAFKQSATLLGVHDTIINNTPDLTLQYADTVAYMCMIVAKIAPEVVYTHNLSDINADHRMVAEACLVACRPKPESSVNKLIACECMSSTDWSFSQIEPTFKPNMYVDVSPYIHNKRVVLELYTTETHEYPDARSVEAAMIRMQYRGSQVGLKHAEAFQLIMERCK